jgi:hypothetical protein
MILKAVSNRASELDDEVLSSYVTEAENYSVLRYWFRSKDEFEEIVSKMGSLLNLFPCSIDSSLEQDGNKRLTIISFGGCGSLSLLLMEATVYVMNNDGKTIDTVHC